MERCRTRHLKPQELAAIAAALAGPQGPDYPLLESIARHAVWVYKRYRAGCSERRRREAAQLLVDIASLKPAGRASAALAVLTAVSLLALNREPLPSPSAVAELALRACRGEEVEPEEAAEVLAGSAGVIARPRSLEEAVMIAAEMGFLYFPWDECGGRRSEPA